MPPRPIRTPSLNEPTVLVGEPARAADLERAIELGARLGEQGFALGDAAHRLLELATRARA